MRRRRYVSAAVDAATGQVLDVFDGRDAADVGRWLSSQPPEWLAGIEVVCCDPHEGYRSGITRARRDTHLSDSVKIGTAVRTRTSNARTEAANARIKDVKRSTRGFRNLHNYRLRILLTAGRRPCQTRPVTPIRTRRPNLVA